MEPPRVDERLSGPWAARVPRQWLATAAALRLRSGLLARLDDSQVRALLLQHLNAATDAGEAASRGRTAGFIGRFEAVAGTLRGRHVRFRIGDAVGQRLLGEDRQTSLACRRDLTVPASRRGAQERDVRIHACRRLVQ